MIVYVVGWDGGYGETSLHGLLGERIASESEVIRAIRVWLQSMLDADQISSEVIGASNAIRGDWV